MVILQSFYFKPERYRNNLVHIFCVSALSGFVVFNLIVDSTEINDILDFFTFVFPSNKYRKSLGNIIISLHSRQLNNLGTCSNLSSNNLRSYFPL